MSADRQGGSTARRRVPLFAIVGLLLGVLSLALPAVPALVAAAGGIILGVLGRRQFRRDPANGPGWVSLAAIIVSGFVFVSQAVILSVVYFSA
ncbi:hypothetical protein [Agromyces mariniharenae]|uniref:DUF4190 domain-containing protein n=1 Tax=Agromyces mariniharenae TaxID=2604423 RepID=A0A5S4UY23_9MICO|nr:hypothetical protein [Agromyces mariniharenae]TYL50513.1 hypothetical protein FYC51_15070 [Agromyces mariniharenae]